MRVAVVACLLAGAASLTGCGALAGESPLDGFPPPRADFERHVAELRDYLTGTQLPGRAPSDVEYNLPFEMPAATDIA